MWLISQLLASPAFSKNQKLMLLNSSTPRWYDELEVPLRLLGGPAFRAHAAVMFSTSHTSKQATGERFGRCVVALPG